MCVVDDAQWLDRASAQMLAFVARRLLADPVGLVFAPRQTHADLAEFPELVVERLRDGDAQTLLGAVLHVPLDERVRDRIVAETHGNPLALVEWPRGLTPAELAGGFGMPATMPMSGQIEESFRRRVAELPMPTQRFLTVAAAEPTGDPVIVWRAAERARRRPAATRRRPIDAGLVEIGARVWFRHPLVRSAAYRRRVDRTERQAAHRALGGATDPDLDPDRRAWHRALGGIRPRRDIAAELEQSAGRARAAAGWPRRRVARAIVVLTADPPRRSSERCGRGGQAGSRAQIEVAARLLALAEAVPLDEMGAGAQMDLCAAGWRFSRATAVTRPGCWSKRHAISSPATRGSRARSTSGEARRSTGGTLAGVVELPAVARASRRGHCRRPGTSRTGARRPGAVRHRGPGRRRPTMAQAVAAFRSPDLAAEEVGWLNLAVATASVHGTRTAGTRSPPATSTMLT